MYEGEFAIERDESWDLYKGLVAKRLVRERYSESALGCLVIFSGGLLSPGVGSGVEKEYCCTTFPGWRYGPNVATNIGVHELDVMVRTVMNRQRNQSVGCVQLENDQHADVREMTMIDDAVHMCDAGFSLSKQDVDRLYVRGLADSEWEPHQWDIFFVVDDIPSSGSLETDFEGQLDSSGAGKAAGGNVWEPGSHEAIKYADTLNGDQELTDKLSSLGWDNHLAVFREAGRRSAVIEFRDVYR